MRALFWFSALTLVYWAGYVMLAVSYAVLRGFTYKTENWPIDLFLIIAGTSLSLTLARPLRESARQALPAQIALPVSLVVLAAVTMEVCFKLMLRWRAPDSGFDSFEPTQIAAGALYWLAPLGLWAAIYMAGIHYNGLRERERRLAAVQIEAHEAQVRALRYQVNPHFLYNALNSIAALILDRRNDRAEQMVLRLAAFFRAGLANDPLRDVELREEVALQQLYLSVEQLRFEDDLNILTHLSDDAERALVPSLILQPIIENSLKFGGPHEGAPLTVTISARSDGDKLIIEIANSGKSLGHMTGTGIGLNNVAGRLQSRYGEEASVDAAPLDGGYLVRLILPFQIAP